ncbi:MAG: autotransporter outer membrane beta-barrel domain-containing protein [Gammaproteobacteria bacterium]|nr:autotransporter outer membrane beta-barrel domain-containing protein [Gammaproteobacteria bacterium]
MRTPFTIFTALSMVSVGATATPPNFSSDLQAVGANGVQDAIGFLVGSVCPRGVPGLGGDLIGVQDPDFQDRCTDIVVAGVPAVAGTDPAAAREGLQSMASEENSAVASTEVDFSGEHQGRIGKRMANLRAGMPSNTVALVGIPLAGGNAGAGMGRWSAFVDGTYGDGDKDGTSLETGFDLDSRGVTVGLDYQSDARTVIGIAVGYTDLEADLSNNAGELDTDSVGVFLYGTYFGSGNWYLDGVLGYTRNDHDQERRLDYTIGATPVDQVASSSNDSDELSVGLTAGYNLSGGAWNLSPYGRIDYADVDIDGYRERMSNPGAPGNGLAVQIDDQDYQSLTLALGLSAYTEWQGNGILWVPQLTAEYVHEFDNDNEDITGSFASEVTGTKFTIPTEEPDRNYFNVGVGFTGFVGDATSVYVQYSSQLGYRDQDLNQYKLGLRVDF